MSLCVRPLSWSMKTSFPSAPWVRQSAPAAAAHGSQPAAVGRSSVGLDHGV